MTLLTIAQSNALTELYAAEQAFEQAKAHYEAVRIRVAPIMFGEAACATHYATMQLPHNVRLKMEIIRSVKFLTGDKTPAVVREALPEDLRKLVFQTTHSLRPAHTVTQLIKGNATIASVFGTQGVDWTISNPAPSLKFQRKDDK